MRYFFYFTFTDCLKAFEDDISSFEYKCEIKNCDNYSTEVWTKSYGNEPNIYNVVVLCCQDHFSDLGDNEIDENMEFTSQFKHLRYYNEDRTPVLLKFRQDCLRGCGSTCQIRHDDDDVCVVCHKDYRSHNPSLGEIDGHACNTDGFGNCRASFIPSRNVDHVKRVDNSLKSKALVLLEEQSSEV